MKNLKIDIRQENGVLSLKCKNYRGVTNDVMFAYVFSIGCHPVLLMCLRK